jgi:hypothetical protein
MRDPAFTPDPSVRYAIATLEFDHSHSATSLAYPTACSDADLPFCFLVYEATVARPGFVIEPLGVESGLLSWQNAAGTVDCNAAVPVHVATWGRLKGDLPVT